MRFKAFDLGGHETGELHSFLKAYQFLLNSIHDHNIARNSSLTAARKLWTSYFPQVDAVVYLVDTADKDR